MNRDWEKRYRHRTGKTLAIIGGSLCLFALVGSVLADSNDGINRDTVIIPRADTTFNKIGTPIKLYVGEGNYCVLQRVEIDGLLYVISSAYCHVTPTGMRQ